MKLFLPTLKSGHETLNNKIAIIQARMGSHRLPGKSMADICGEPLLQHVLERVTAAKLLDKIVVATTYEGEDNAIETLCSKLDIQCVRGPVRDVLDRFIRAAKITKAEYIVRICGDCPLLDPDIIDMVVRRMSYEFNKGEHYQIMGTGDGWPDGLDVEVISLMALKNADMNAMQPSDREHVTPYIWKTSPNSLILDCAENLRRHRWTVDTERDLDFVRAVMPLVDGYSYKEVLRVLDEHPEFLKLNDGQVRNEGYKISVEADGR